ncbi:MAG TPA: acetate--CoA ligase family protein [Pseudolabrys sp.]|nr:acetate--CoA ligase family protein [Pseudolabrys sp.]
MSLDKLMNPRSIAVVGASAERQDAIGTRVIRNLRSMGYRGRIYPVNPRYETVSELRCFRSLSELPERVDAAFLAVPAAQGPDLVEEAAKKGIAAIFMNANGYADGGEAGLALQRRVEAVAKAHGIAICGPNNLGLINVNDGAAIWTPKYMMDVKPGPLAVISQSGSVAIALADDERKIGFSYLITAGNEAVVTVAEYLRYCAQDDRVGVILVYLETIRRVEAFAEAAREAQRRGKPVIVLKLGASEGGRALVQAHTGSLAGEDRLYDALFRKLDIVRVHDIDEMLETAIMLSAYPKRRDGNLVAVTLSGGEAALIADTASSLGVTLQKLSPATLDRLRPAFPPYSKIGNPVDAWGLGFNAERFGMIVDALLADPEIGTIAFSVDAPGAGGADVPYACTMAEIAVGAAERSDKHFVFFNNTSGTGPNPEVRVILDRARIPYLSGMRTALTAIGYALRERSRSHIVDVRPVAGRDLAAASTDVARFKLLAEAGLPMAECVPVTSAADAARAAVRFGAPVVLKGSAPRLPHKSDLGLVHVGLRSAAEVEVAYAGVSKTLEIHVPNAAEREIYVQPMSKPGVELILGVRNEPGFGSFVVVGVGGLFVELIKQASIRVGPVDEKEALAMLHETPAAKLLGGFRGNGPYDIDAVTRAIAALSRFGAATLGQLASVEINPLIVHESGAVGVDVLIEPAAGKNRRTP